MTDKTKILTKVVMRADKKNELSVKRKIQLENISYLRASLAKRGEK